MCLLRNSAGAEMTLIHTGMTCLRGLCGLSFGVFSEGQNTSLECAHHDNACHANLSATPRGSVSPASLLGLPTITPFASKSWLGSNLPLLYLGLPEQTLLLLYGRYSICRSSYGQRRYAQNSLAGSL